MLLNNKNATKKLFLDFGLFWPFFNQKKAKKQPTKKNWQNPNRLMKFSEIWYVDAFQQRKCYKKNWIPAFFGRFSTKKQLKNIQKYNWQNPNRLMKFSEIWYVDASQQKKMLQIYFWISAFFGRFLTKKLPKLTKNEEIGKIQTV